jgi:8-oxo-dGTP pyrophosphatase MutT (NUDIX family)
VAVSDEAIPAATLILVRDRPAGAPQLLMVERAGGMAFAAGAWVFPGGRIDDDDRRLGNDVGVDPAAVAAIRETVEETAVAAGLSPLPDMAAARALQDELVADAPFADLLKRHGLALDASALTPFARWVPRFHAVRRFDTLFFLARCPDGEWEPRVIEGECSGAAWLTAGELLDRDARGEARLIFPTRRNLERLAQFASFAEARAHAEAIPVRTITPWLEQREGRPWLAIPHDAGYPIDGEPITSAHRG